MSAYVTKPTPGDTGWFVHDRFGMFIHFGLYAMPARNEWIMTWEKMSQEHYQRYFDHFDPDLFDARQWAKAAREAGMKYAVLTAKHHEGFCLYDSQYTDFKITNTPFGRDLVKEYVEAFRAEGLKVGLYYSLLDWHHPDFIIDSRHPMRDRPDALEENSRRDMRKYAQYMRDQVRELLTNYGQISILWFDFTYPTTEPAYPQFAGKTKEDWESEELIRLARSLQPGIIIDNRSGIEQDLATPEQNQPERWPRHKKTGELLVWEACQTFSGSWGYHRDEMSWKSPKMLVEMLCKTVALGGNLLMNVGPCARGYMDHRANQALEVFGQWMRYHSRAIYGCTMADPEFTAPTGTVLTQSQDGKRLYVHLLSYPFFSLSMKHMEGKVAYAQFLHDGSEILYTTGKPLGMLDEGEKTGLNEVFFSLPTVQPDVQVPVIEIFLK